MAADTPDERASKLQLLVALQTTLGMWESKLNSGEMTLAEAASNYRTIQVALRRAMEWAIPRIDDDNGAAVVVSYVVGVAGELLNHVLDRTDLLLWRTSALKGAQKAGTVTDVLAHMTNLAYLHFSNGNIEEAKRLASESINVADSTGDSALISAALQNAGIIESQTGDSDTAISLLNRALFLLQPAGEETTRAKVLSVLAVCYSDAGDTAHAIETVQKAIELEKDPVSRGTSICNLAGYLITDHRLDEARVLLDDVLNIALETTSSSLKGLQALQFARWCILQPDNDVRNKALDAVESALHHYTAIGDRRGERQALEMQLALYESVTRADAAEITGEQLRTAYRGIIVSNFSLEKFREAAQAAEKLIGLAAAAGDLVEAAEAASIVGQCSVMLKDYAAAIAAHEQAIGFLSDPACPESFETSKLRAETQHSLGQAARRIGMIDRAIACFTDVIAFCEGLTGTENEGQFDELEQNAKGNLGLARVDAGQFEEGIAMLKAVYERYHESRNYRLEGHSLFNIAYAYYRMDDLVSAQRDGEKAIDLMALISDREADDARKQMAGWFQSDSS